jgi:hypothetical protein
VLAALCDLLLYGLLKLPNIVITMFGKDGGTLMPKLRNRLPKKCRDRNPCISWHNGKRIYHGVWDSPGAEESYKRFIAALLENPALPLRDARTGNADALVTELCDAFLQYHSPEPEFYCPFQTLY